VTGPVEVAGKAGIAAEDVGMGLVEGRTVMEGVKDRRRMFEVAVAVVVVAAAAAVFVEIAAATVETVAVVVVVAVVAVAVAAVAEGAAMGLANSGSESGHLFDLLDFR
jgi:hypothetical protein